MQARVTLRDVAAKAGVHHTTASRALKNDPRLAEKTLIKIKALAEQMGYVPDPMLGALNAYRQASRHAQYRGTVAWVTNFPDRNGWRLSACYRLYFQGAKEQLERQGYRLDEFWLREPKLTADRASQILIHRGIRGLLICPLAISRGHLSLQWEKFSAVSFGYSLLYPKLHLFTAAHYRAMIMCMRKLRTRGCRRIGMVASYNMNLRMDGMWTSAYRGESLTPPRGETLPICLLGGKSRSSDSGQGDKELVLKWYRTYKPEAIVSPTDPVFEWLKEEGVRIPQDVVVVSASNHEEGLVPGIIEPSREIGRAAADFLVGMLQRGECGIPSTPQRILLEGKWFDGIPAGKKAEAMAAH